MIQYQAYIQYSEKFSLRTNQSESLASPFENRKLRILCLKAHIHHQMV